MNLKDVLFNLFNNELDDNFDRLKTTLSIDFVHAYQDVLCTLEPNLLNSILILITNIITVNSIEIRQKKNSEFIKKYFIDKDFVAFQKNLRNNTDIVSKNVYENVYTIYSYSTFKEYNLFQIMITRLIVTSIRILWADKLYGFKMSFHDKFVLNLFIIFIILLWFNLLFKDIEKDEELKELKNKYFKEITQFFNNYNIIYENDSFEEHESLIKEKITNLLEQICAKGDDNLICNKDYVITQQIQRIVNFLLFLVVPYNSTLSLLLSNSLQGCVLLIVKQLLALKENAIKDTLYYEILNQPFIEKKFETYYNPNASVLFKITNLSHKFETQLIYDNTSLEIPAKKFIIFFGNSGSGKSIFCRFILKRLVYDSGEITFMENYSDYCYENIRANLSFLNVSDKDLFDNTLFYNLTYGVKNVDEETKNTINKYLKLFRLDKYINETEKHVISELSSGQQQLIKIIRLILNDKSIWILDEITSNIDEYVELIVLEELKRIQIEKQKNVIFITHNKTLNNFADNTMFIKDHQIYIQPNQNI